ncbi:TVP38/TMEM64 family protein [Butyrivibrio sp. WCD2001]|uniref:TVP38/TMEM64 family protein n=1 Tax=Butyrivibrio sp. WCD2001 TaxID=1280681 RepID=UPI000402ED63|nr:VTT domain-containing protein [Butyrivibrio sp. WCD2001]
MKRKDLVRRILIITFIVLFLLAVYFFVGRPMIDFVGNPDELKQYIESKGIKGLLVFCFLVMIQTMSTCIPGTPFYMGAGYVLGGFKGALLCDAAATAGNTIAFLIGRKFGRKLLENLFSEKKIESVEKYIKKGNPKLIHIMFMLLPLPKDTYAWFGYYSEESVFLWIPLTFIARFTHIFIYSFGGNKIQEKQYGVLILGVTIAVIVYAVIFIKLHKARKGD